MNEGSLWIPKTPFPSFSSATLKYPFSPQALPQVFFTLRYLLS